MTRSRLTLAAVVVAILAVALIAGLAPHRLVCRSQGNPQPLAELDGTQTDWPRAACWSTTPCAVSIASPPNSTATLP